MFININPLYSTVTSKYLFWHSAYIGLSSHPNAKLKYNIYNEDSAASNYVKEYSINNFGNQNWQSLIGFKGYEKILKDRYFEILKTDTSYILINYIMKPIDFLKLLYENIFKKIFFPMLILTVLLNILFNFIKIKRKDIIEDKSYLYLFITSIFSFIPSFILFPSLEYSLITMVLCIIIIFYGCFNLMFFRFSLFKK